MSSWKRIVVTAGAKIGKSPLSYAPGAAGITAMATIGAADHLGSPVSTTHVLSSRVAGGHDGRESLQMVVVDGAQPADGVGGHCPPR